MKKSWKKILCSLMLAPCMFLAVACGDDPNDPNNLTVDLTAEQQQEAYTTLRTLASSMLDNDGTKDQAYTFEYELEKGINKNIDNAGLTETNKSIVNASHILDLTDKTTQIVYGGYKTNNQGYFVNKVNYDGKNISESYSENYSEIIKFSNSQYNTYTNADGEKTVSKVTNNYSKNKVLFDKDILENTEAYSMIEFFNLIDSSDIYNDFKSTLATWISRTIAEGRVENYYEVDFSEFINSNYSYSLNGGVYSFSVKIDLDASNSALRFLEDGNLVGEGEITIEYKLDSIQKITFDFDSTMVLEEAPARVFGDIIQQEFSSEDKVVTTNCKNTNIVLDFSTGFDNNFFNQSLSDYKGQGENNAILNRDATVKIRSSWANVDIVVRSGTNLLDSVYSAISETLIYYGFELLYASYDIFGLEKIQETDLVPSYDITVYATIGEPPVDKLTTEVNVFIKNTGAEEICIFYIGDNLYEILKAVWGLTDEQIVGIYSDANLENKYETSTLITDGMTIYVVLEDGWSPIPTENN